MSAALEVLGHLLLLALAVAKIARETWQIFPHDAPVRFHSTDLLALAAALVLLLRVLAFPSAPWLLGSRVGKAVRWAQSPRVSGWCTLLLFVSFFGFFLLVHAARHWSLITELYDHTFVHRALFRPWGSPPLRCEVMGNGTFLSAHLAFSFLLLSPLTAFVHSDELVFLLQALVVALPLWLAFAAGPLRRHRETWPLAFLLVACHPALRNGLVWDFREDALAFCFLLAGAVALMRRRLALYALCLALALLSKENIAFIAPFLALPILLDRELALGRRARIALAAGTVAASALWAVASLEVLIPRFNPRLGADHDIVGYFPGLGSTPAAVVRSLLGSPSTALSLAGERLFTGEALTYLAFLLVPWLFFARRGGWWLAPALPGILMNTLGARPYLRHLAFHYDWAILAFLVLALLGGIGREAESGGGIAGRRWAAALLVAFAFSGGWPLANYAARFVPSRVDVREVRYLRGLPREGVLGVGRNQAIAQLGHVPEIRLFNQAPFALARDRARSWSGFWELNRSDGTGIPGHGAHEATRMLLDLRDAAQAFVAAEAPRRGWRVLSLSPSGRYAYLARG